MIKHKKDPQEYSVIAKKNVAVIGGGIIGINCALELQSRGFDVTLFDKEGLADGCSKGNAGHFATEQVFPLAEKKLLWQLPSLLMNPLGPVSIRLNYLFNAIPWFCKFVANMTNSNFKKNSLALKSLNDKAIEYYLPLLKEANAEHLLTKRGSLLVYESHSPQQAKYDHQHYSSAGVSVDFLTREECLKLEPNLHNNIKHGLFFSDVAHTCNPHDLCIALWRLAKSKGAQFKTLKIDSVSQTQDYEEINTVSIYGQKEKHTFNNVVITTGAWSKTIINNLGYKLPIEAERGYHLMLDMKNSLTRPVVSAERKFIMTPMSDGLRLAGTTEFAGLNALPNYTLADNLYRNATNILSHLSEYSSSNSDNKQYWMGNRPSLPDSLPVIGQAPHHKNIYFALGHQHLGLTQGAITGKLVGQLLQDEKTDIDVKPFSISRFQ